MIFDKLPDAPGDPLLAALAAFRADTNPRKVDLGVGVYRDEAGQTPVLECVKSCERWLAAHQDTKAYLSPAGEPAFNTAMQNLVLGADHDATQQSRAFTVQTVGGSGALRSAAELIRRGNPDATVWLPDPTWANHGPLIGSAGLKCRPYAYYDRSANGVNEDAMLRALGDVKAGDAVVIHGCCHNPTGADLTSEQWSRLAALLSAKGAVPLVDVAYQGFAAGLEEDAANLRALGTQVPEMLITSSCSKNFGLYRERVGALTVIASTPDQCESAQRHVLGSIRATYSMPPDHGAAVVARILGTPDLRKTWFNELDAMRKRIKTMRTRLADALGRRQTDRFAYIRGQNGMFSCLDITPAHVERMRAEYHIHAVSTGRVNLAGLTESSVDYVANALAEVLKRDS